MYHYIEDKEFLKKLRSVCSNLVNQLVQEINNEGKMIVVAHSVGSGSRNLETQNEFEPVDLDYNISIIRSWNINDCQGIKEYIRKKFNVILNRNGWGDCQDSTSALTTEYRNFTSGNKTRFSIDLGIVVEDSNGSWWRLIHQKTGNTRNDVWIWNEGRNSYNLNKKDDWLKNHNYWNEVREGCLTKKNMYLTRNEYNHPSFICYIEAVNEVYDRYNHRKKS